MNKFKKLSSNDFLTLRTIYQQLASKDKYFFLLSVWGERHWPLTSCNSLDNHADPWGFKRPEAVGIGKLTWLRQWLQACLSHLTGYLLVCLFTYFSRGLRPYGEVFDVICWSNAPVWPPAFVCLPAERHVTRLVASPRHVQQQRHPECSKK